LDSESVKEKITDKTKVIIPVHLYGLISNMDSISEIANNRNIAILEDACQSHGAEYGQRAGVLGDLATFSFYPSKNMTVGGMEKLLN
jgi:perosamine synthetase